MTNKEFVALEKKLLRQTSGFVICGKNMVLPPADKLLRVLDFYGTSAKTKFTLRYGVMPLCFPTPVISTDIGDDLRSKGIYRRWDTSSPDLPDKLALAINSIALPFLSKFNSLMDYVEAAKRSNPRNFHTGNRIAFSLAREGLYDQALTRIDDLLPQPDLSSSWQREMHDTLLVLRDKILQGPQEAQEQLEKWEAETRRNLKLDKLFI